MTLPEQGHLLRIYLSEDDRQEGLPLYEWLLKQARRHGLAGATVLRGMSGFGRSSRLHTTKILCLSDDLPIIVEIVDTIEKIDAFLEEIDPFITHGLATVEDVRVHFYRGKPRGASS